MFCSKCGKEITNGFCNNCDLKENVQEVIFDKPKNADTIFILGILSFIFSPLSIIALILGRKYNKKNNYGNCPDIKSGKRCAIISFTIFIATFLICLLAIVGMFDFFNFIVENID